MASSVEDTLAALLDIAQAIDGTAGEIVDNLQTIDQTLESLGDKLDKGGGGGGTGGGGSATGGNKGGGTAGKGSPSKSGGGGSSGLYAAARKHPVVAAFAATAAAVGPHVGAGFTAAARGGDFASGMSASLQRLVAALPLVGEASGASGAQRIEQATKARVGSFFGTMAGLGADPASEDNIRKVFDVVIAQERWKENAVEKSHRLADKWVNEDPGIVGDRTRVSLVDVQGADRGYYGQNVPWYQGVWEAFR